MTHLPHTHPLPAEAERRVRGLLDGSVPDGERPAAMEHLRECSACREVYDAIAAAEHEVAGGGGILGVPALERVAARLQSEPVAARRRRTWTWRAAAAATAAAALLVVGLRIGLPTRDDGFTARGGPMEDGVGIRVFRVGVEGATELNDGGLATVGDELGVSVSTGPYRSLTLAVRAPGGTPLLAATTENVARDVIDEPLDWTARVEPAFLDAGSITVEAVFSEPSPDGAPPVARRAMTLRVKEAAP